MTTQTTNAQDRRLSTGQRVTLLKIDDVMAMTHRYELEIRQVIDPPVAVGYEGRKARVVLKDHATAIGAAVGRDPVEFAAGVLHESALGERTGWGAKVVELCEHSGRSEAVDSTLPAGSAGRKRSIEIPI